MQLFREILTVAAVVPLILASLVAIGNLVGPLRATEEHGYSFVPFLSIVFCGLAFLCAQDVLGLWAFLPAALDLGNWAMVGAAIYFGIHRLKGDGR